MVFSSQHSDQFPLDVPYFLHRPLKREYQPSLSQGRARLWQTLTLTVTLLLMQLQTARALWEALGTQTEFAMNQNLCISSMGHKGLLPTSCVVIRPQILGASCFFPRTSACSRPQGLLNPKSSWFKSLSFSALRTPGPKGPTSSSKALRQCPTEQGWGQSARGTSHRNGHI